MPASGPILTGDGAPWWRRLHAPRHHRAEGSALSTGIGETLRSARRRQGHTLADVAASTRVRETYLAAIESEEFEALGGDVYARGFITAYARFLELDPDPLLRAHKEYRDGQERDRYRRRRAQHGRRELQPGEMRVRSGRVALLLALVLVVVVAVVVAGLWGDGAASARPLLGWM